MMRIHESRSLGEKGQGRRTFNCGIILVDEMALNQLDGQARFTDTTTANDDELVLSQELTRREANVSYSEEAKARDREGGKRRGWQAKTARARVANVPWLLL
jgi:hypothetical protein